MQKVRICLYSLFSLCFLWFFLNIGVGLVAPGYEILIGTWGRFPLIQRMLNILAFLSGLALAVLYYLRSGRKIGNQILLFFTGLGLLALTLCSNFIFALLDDMDYHSFSSPDAAHTIVIGERSFLQAGWVSVYERVNPFLIRYRDSASTDDGHKPICHGTYHFTWRQEGFDFSFSDGEGGVDTISVTF